MHTTLHPWSTAALRARVFTAAVLLLGVVGPWALLLLARFGK
jgi:hypothetical protein